MTEIEQGVAAPEPLVLTFAELAALADLSPRPADPRLLGTLRIEPEYRTDPVRQAGLASLIARDLVRLKADELLFATGPRLVVTALGRLGTVTEVGVVTQDGADGMFVLDADGARLAVRPRPSGCYAVTALDPAAALAGQLVAIAAGLLGSSVDGVVAIVLGDVEPDQTRSVVLGVEQAQWYLATTGESGDRRTGDRDELVAELGVRLAALTD